MSAPGSVAAGALELLAGRGQSLAVAESLTGGLVAGALTAVPGASRVLRGSVTAYATDLKRELLGVDGALLAARGAVDAEVARQMAEGVRRVLGADWGIATTGVAGPEPQDGQPVGTVFVAVCGPGGAGEVRRLALAGDRDRIRRDTIDAVLALLLSELTENARAQDTEQHGGNGCLQP
ncbi:CinA family protein [Streptomyces lydicus]|uniref:Damage-inducible protein CinA n=1 Tax=Streptomyces lydicus TaxID=47763 RepID=A0A1D7VRT9_9ACTN|nr:nicotinamide-nucleotide amidohydrolase family protein [Streptomyces lydicus]AOP49459.1 damage-inducible protein CinA [Streptomyces lydicus]